MTATTLHTVQDSMTMLRRRLLHLRRYPTLTVMLVGQPALFLLLFAGVFGGTLGNGLGSVAGGRAEYLHFLVPGIVVMAVSTVAVGTAVAVAMDAKGGIIARFRTMAIAPSSVLTGHVLGALVQSALAVVVSVAVAVAMGYRPDAGPLDLLVTAGLIGLLALALTWLMVAFGLAAKSVESASNLPMLLMLMPFLGSGFVPTDSMPAGLRLFADHQPFTAVIDALRRLLDGAAPGSDLAVAAVWCVGLTVVGWGLAVRTYAAERAS
jgi:ABC-2 type transport system permease protein